MKQATFNYNRAEGYSSKGKHSTAKKSYNKSENLYKDALEILQEILHYDSSLRVWFDRDISFEVGDDLSADIVSQSRLDKGNEALRRATLTSDEYEALYRAMHIYTAKHSKLDDAELRVRNFRTSVFCGGVLTEVRW